MDNPIWHSIHPQFKLNDVSYNFEELKEIGYCLVKEGHSFEAPIGDFIMDWTSNKSTLEVFTSGTTGKPKKIELRKEYMVNSAMATAQYFHLKPNQSALLCLPCTGIAGKMMLVRAMALGLQLDYVKPIATPLHNSKKKYDFVAMVPLQVQKSIKELPNINTLIIGGAPVEPGLREKLSKLSINAYETYGMTETITHIAVKKITANASESFETLPNVLVSVDERGCLVVHAPKISDVKIVTNDLVEIVAENRFIWKGRYDTVINSGGIKLIPEEIEKKLSKVVPFRFFVTGIHDTLLGTKLALVIETSQVDRSSLLNKIKILPDVHPYEVPKEIYPIKSFVETKSGKLNRKKIMEQIQ